MICVASAIGVLACGSAGVGPETSTPVARNEDRPASPPLLYVVRPGDSLSRIASCSGVSVAELARINRISDPDLVVTGTRLVLPRGRPCVARSLPAAPTPSAAGHDGSAGVASARAGQLLAKATAKHDAADFEGALSLAQTCVQRLVPYSADTKAKEIRARCHVVAGMAAAGLDRRQRAIEEFRQAFLLDPNLKLAPETTSPRILELVSAAQESP